MNNQKHLINYYAVLTFLLFGCSGNNWIKDEKSDCVVYNKNPQESEYILYEGDCLDGKAHGFGKVHWYQDSMLTSVTEGHFINGKLEGEVFVEYFTPPLEKFYGTYKNDIKEGLGTYYYSFGKIIKSNFTNDMPSDSTIITWQNGKKYVGMIDDNLRLSGKGRIYFPNKDYYEGGFLNNRRNGMGLYVWANGDRYEGEYENDKRKINGIYYFTNGAKAELKNITQEQQKSLQLEQASIDLKGMINPDVAIAVNSEIFQSLEYPHSFRKVGIEFEFYILLFFDVNGKVINYKIKDIPNSAGDIAENAIKIIMSYRFPVSSEEGETFQLWAKLPFRFRLRKY